MELDERLTVRGVAATLQVRKSEPAGLRPRLGRTGLLGLTRKQPARHGPMMSYLAPGSPRSRPERDFCTANCEIRKGLFTVAK